MAQKNDHIEECLDTQEKRNKIVRSFLKKERYTPQEQEVLKRMMKAKFIKQHYQSVLRPFDTAVKYGCNLAFKCVPVKTVYVKRELSEEELNMLKLIDRIAGDTQSVAKKLIRAARKLLFARQKEFKKATRQNLKRYRT